MNRRRFLGAAGVAASSLLLPGCGFSTAGSNGGQDASSLSFTTWGTASELAGLRRIVEDFQRAHDGVRVDLNAVPYEQMFTTVDAQLQAGNPPDLFRVPYYTLGAYAGRGQLLDLTPHLTTRLEERFTTAAWAAVGHDGKPYGVPHHTDTSVILYNKTALETAGIHAVPTSPQDAWTWEEFAHVAQTLRRSLPGRKYPFADNWQGSGVTRWLSWLFQAGGRFLDDDLVTPAIDSPAGRRAVAFTKDFFPRRFVPQNSSVKSATYAADMWYAQTTAMTFGGAFLLPDAAADLDFPWGATYAPRDTRAGGDFGGNALVATARTKKPALAAAFLDFATGKEAMRRFCAGASLLPTRRDLVEEGIRFTERPDLGPVFFGQARTVRGADAAQVASPHMAGIITVLQDQLERAFVGGQSTARTLSRLSQGIAKATK